MRKQLTPKVRLSPPRTRNPMALSSDDFAGLLNPAQLELLSEFEDELDLTNLPAAATRQLRIKSALANSPQLRDLVAKLQASKLRAPDAAKPATKAPKPADPAAPNPYVDEWSDELAREVPEDEKHERRLPAVPTREELRQMLKAAEVKRRDHLIIRLFYSTGVRRAELAAITLADLNLREQKIFIRSGKGDKDRYVLIDQATASMLERFVYGRALDDPIFDVGDDRMNDIVKQYAKDLGLLQRYEAIGRRYSAHCLRHAFATHLWESGIDLLILKDLLGHQFLSTTEKYVQIGIGKALNDYNAHHPLADRNFWKEPDE